MEQFLLLNYVIILEDCVQVGAQTI